MDTNEIKERVIKRKNIPRHVAIIMDGNGRWAKQRNLKRVDGHIEGVNSVRDVVEVCGEIGVEAVTFYTFSTENWKRPKTEVLALWKLLIRTIRKEVPDLQRNNVRLVVSGLIDELPAVTRQSVLFAIDALNKNTGLILNLALNYSSRMEITRAVQELAQEVKAGRLLPEEINESTISDKLFTAGLPDPDLLIRTSGEYRISNFMLWQIAYAEIYITNTLWPDFRKYEFYQAIEAYQCRERRFGMISEQVRLEAQ
ncbi:isoprenyl transferase [candidate division KSB1 bacterium]|nr:isoprenyl transferase [candidate division KSB1 bacterium]